MKARDLVIVVVLCLCLALAIGSGFYLIGGGPATSIAIVLAIFALVVSQVVVFGAQAINTALSDDKFRTIQSAMNTGEKSNAELHRQSEFVLTQLTDLRGEAARNAALVSQGFADLKTSYSTLAQEMQASTQRTHFAAPINANPLDAFRQPILKPILPEPKQVQAEPPPPFSDQLLVALEPIVDLHNGRTAHYRIHLGMKSETGVELGHEALLQQADRMGLRTQLDIFVAREAALLLRRLRQRDGNLIMFMPIGSATLATPDALKHIIDDRRAETDIAAGLAFELPHAVLAGLTDQALEGLATMAREGILLALSNASVSGLDLNALSTLNVRYVGLDMGALGEHGKPTPAIIGFAQAARASRVNLIITGVTNPEVIASLPQVSRLAAGPCFAAPRRVKRELAQQVSHSYNVAA
jgi:EAL domain-containing protein (putative c-di-GMP-specific phosphodiesterase class I)